MQNSELRIRIEKDLAGALKEKDGVKVSTLRLLNAAVKNYEIAKQGTSYRANDEEVVGVIQKEVKQRKESIEAFRKGNREDMAKREEEEMAILQGYLPQQLSEEEVAKIIDRTIKETGAISATDIGKVMGVLSQELRGKIDLSQVSQIVREKLSL